jgi:hypothetical protein
MSWGVGVWQAGGVVYVRGGLIGVVGATGSLWALHLFGGGDASNS